MTHREALQNPAITQALLTEAPLRYRQMVAQEGASPSESRYVRLTKPVRLSKVLALLLLQT